MGLHRIKRALGLKSSMKWLPVTGYNEVADTSVLQDRAEGQIFVTTRFVSC